MYEKVLSLYIRSAVFWFSWLHTMCYDIPVKLDLCIFQSKKMWTKSTREKSFKTILALYQVM